MRLSRWCAGAGRLVPAVFLLGGSVLGASVPPAPPASPAQPQPLTVSVASSLTDVMAQIDRAFQQQGGVPLALNAGGSNVLARQIVDGAPAAVFISADEAQMDVAERAGRLVPGSRRNLLSNVLVVIVPARAAVDVAAPADLAAAGVRRIAMANPESVPAGVYGRQWLERAGLWGRLASRIVPTSTARAALAAVSAGRADAGIVFATDARTSSGVRVAYRVPAGDTPSIRYPAAAVRGKRESDALRLIAFLESADAYRIFEAAGFVLLPSTGKPQMAQMAQMAQMEPSAESAGHASGSSGSSAAPALAGR